MADTINYTNIAPEVLIYNLVDSILEYLRQDILENSSNPKRMVLYDILSDLSLLKHNYLEEGMDLFSRNKEHPRYVDIRQVFDAQRAKEPTIHITLSSDNQDGINSIGLGEDEFYYEGEDEFIEESGVVVDEATSPIYKRSFGTTLQLVMTSSNHHEVLLMYYVLRSCLIGSFDSMELGGFQNIKFSGRELQIREDITPNIFARGLSISGFYEVRVRRLLTDRKFRDIFIKKTLPFETDS